MPGVDDYELIDAGDGRRLERFGPHVVDRPAPGAIGPRRRADRWLEADITFEGDGRWSGPGLPAARDGWTTRIGDLDLDLRPTDAGQVGVFPEHAAMLPWLRERVQALGTPSVLHLFASTGLTTLALARAGASVAHVDAARSAIAWARRNAARNDLADAPIRWLIDDAGSFVARELRRGRRYGGVVLDPPTYGHGVGGRPWRIESDLPPLLDDIRRLCAPDAFLLLTAHTDRLAASDLGRILGSRGVETGELALTARSGGVLRLGVYARLARHA